MAKETADGTATAAGQEKVQDKKGAGDVPAMAGEELVIKAPVHCDGCGRKLRRSLQRLQGVGDVSVDSRTNTVVVSGRGAVENAAEVMEVVERKTGEKAVPVSPSPEKLPPLAAKGGGEANKKDDTVPEVDMEMVTILKMNLHCEACSEEIKRRILKITGVEEAVPHLKSSQMMVKGKVEPATLVGFIHKCTGRKAAIIRAEPLDLPQPLKSPPMAVAPPAGAAETKNDDPSGDSGEKKNGKKEEEQHEENKGDSNVDENDPKTEKPGDGGHGATEEHGSHDNAGDGLVQENHSKNDRLFTVPMPAGVVTVAPEMALNNYSDWYPPYQYAHYPYYYQYPQAAYPAYGCSPAMYGYGYPHYPQEAVSEESPNACTIV